MVSPTSALTQWVLAAACIFLSVRRWYTPYVKMTTKLAQLRWRFSHLSLSAQNLDPLYTAWKLFCLSQSLQNLLVLRVIAVLKYTSQMFMTFYNYLQSQTKIFFGKTFIPYLQVSHSFQNNVSCLANISVGKTEPSCSVKMSHHLLTVKWSL